MTADIGNRLRGAREQRGLSLHDAATRTKLSINVLQAIERNDFASLPGGMFRKAYVRTLAAEVGLDPNEIASDYCAQFERPPEPAVQDPNVALAKELVEQLTPSSRPSFVTLAVVTATVAAWFMLQPAPAGPTLLVDDDTAESVALAPAALAAPAPTLPLRIELAATGWCWIASDIDGERVLFRLVAPGERLVLEGQRLISLRLGDAGAVTLSINDGPRRPLGGNGEVVELEVTPDNVGRLREGVVDT